MKAYRFARLAIAAFGLAGLTAAHAADLPTRKAAPEPVFAPPPFNWTGIYVGLNAGAVWGTGSTTVTGSPALLGLGSALVPGTLSNSSSAGFIGGGQIGYNYQMGAGVFGVEADIDGTSLSRSGGFTTAATLGVGGPTLTYAGSSRLDYLGTVRARVGFTPWDRLLVYATGGLAYGGTHTSASLVANGTADVWSGSNDPVRTGWTVGGGVEYALTNNISLRAEYLYYDLGKQSTTAAANAAAVAAFGAPVYLSTSTQFDGSIARAGINYRF
jgi:outer membrane immunogenic protein